MYIQNPCCWIYKFAPQHASHTSEREKNVTTTTKKYSHKSEVAQFTAADRCPGCDKRNLSMFTALSIWMTYHADPYNDFSLIFTLSLWKLINFFSLTLSLSLVPLVEVKKANKWKWENFWTCFILDSTTLVAKHMLSRCHRLNGQFLFWCICVKQTRNVSMNFRIPLSATKLWIRGTEKPEIQLNAKKWKICSNETRSKISHLWWWWWWCSSSTWWWGSRGELVLEKNVSKYWERGFIQYLLMHCSSLYGADTEKYSN